MLVTSQEATGTLQGQGGSMRRADEMHTGSAAMCCHAFGTIGARGSSIQSRTQGVGGQGICRYSWYRGKPSDWIGGSYAVTVSRHGSVSRRCALDDGAFFPQCRNCASIGTKIASLLPGAPF